MLFRSYAMWKEKYLVEILNDDSERGYNIKIAKMHLSMIDGSLQRSINSRWVHMTELEKIPKEVVDIMVASGAV